jgi:MinD superfamily P-loop ATPase
MKIAVLSGKGGTGKTTVSANLAVSIGPCQYVDCDVEEPNGALFLKPVLTGETIVSVTVPKVDEIKCTGCGNCAKACQFHSIAVIKGKVLLFPEICHHCGACALVCPQDAITEVDRGIGVIETDAFGYFMQGRLALGEPVALPIIRQMKHLIRNDIPVILDCGPGASCTVVQTIDGCDYCILVTEPTPFGLHDLRIAVQLVRKLGISLGVILNKVIGEDESIQQYCSEQRIEVLMEIPFSREIAASYSNGVLPAQFDSDWKAKFLQVYKTIESGARS